MLTYSMKKNTETQPILKIESPILDTAAKEILANGKYGIDLNQEQVNELTINVIAQLLNAPKQPTNDGAPPKEDVKVKGNPTTDIEIKTSARNQQPLLVADMKASVAYKNIPFDLHIRINFQNDIDHSGCLAQTALTVEPALAKKEVEKAIDEGGNPNDLFTKALQDQMDHRGVTLTHASFIINPYSLHIDVLGSAK